MPFFLTVVLIVFLASLIVLTGADISDKIKEGKYIFSVDE